MILNSNKYAIVRDGVIKYYTNSSSFNALSKVKGRFWYLEIADTNSFTGEVLNEVIPLHVHNLIKNSNVQLMLIHSLEGYHSIVESIYKRLICDKGIPEEKIIFYSESYNILEAINYWAEKLNKKSIKTVYARIIECKFANAIANKPVISDKQPITKKYLNLNRRWRPHRPTLVGLLASKNLLKQGYVSLSNQIDGNNWDNTFDYLLSLNQNNKTIVSLLQDNKEKIFNLPSLIVDIEDLSVNGNWLQIQHGIVNYYNKTMFSLISETNFYFETDKESSIFITEKTYKAILYRHPFVIAAVPHFLKALRDNGYKTFGNIINEDYDSVEDDADRLLMVLNEVERLCNLTKDQEEKFLIESKAICDYNYNLLLSRTNLGDCLLSLN